MADQAQTPKVYQDFFIDSTYWEAYKPRKGDIIIATPPKAGTTWTQQIIAQLLFKSEDNYPEPLAKLSPWVEFRHPPKDVKMQEINNMPDGYRRMVKTHCPADGLPYYPEVQYVLVMRDGRDVIWSWHHHWAACNDTHYKVVNDSPGRVGPPIPRAPPTAKEYFDIFMASEDGYPILFWPFCRSWFARRHQPNVHIMHFDLLKKDLAGEMRKLGQFLGTDYTPELFEKQVQNCTYSHMSTNAQNYAPMGGALWEGGAKTFFAGGGRNHRWRDTLSEEEVAAYEERALKELGEDCARWVATGALPEARPSAIANGHTNSQANGHT